MNVPEPVAAPEATVTMESGMDTNTFDAAANRATDEGSNRNLASIRPSFIVKNLETSISYYRERLGFQLDFQGPDDGPFWAGMSRDGIGIMLKAVAPDVLPCPNQPGTSGRLRTRTSTAWILMRSSRSSASAVRRS